MYEGKIAKNDRVRFPRGWGRVEQTRGHDVFVAWDGGTPSWVTARYVLEVVPTKAVGA